MDAELDALISHAVDRFSDVVDELIDEGMSPAVIAAAYCGGVGKHGAILLVTGDFTREKLASELTRGIDEYLLTHCVMGTA